MIESGVIKYGKEFEESMEAGGWDLSKVDTKELEPVLKRPWSLAK
jgi:F-type H+-transporting ATPase subunit beta